jgi:hypothetical protein
MNTDIKLKNDKVRTDQGGHLRAAAGPRLAILPDILTRGGAILDPDHPDYPALFALAVGEFTERFLAGDISVARYFKGPPIELPLSVRHLYEPPALQTSSPENIKEAKAYSRQPRPDLTKTSRKLWSTRTLPKYRRQKSLKPKACSKASHLHQLPIRAPKNPLETHLHQPQPQTLNFAQQPSP